MILIILLLLIVTNNKYILPFLWILGTLTTICLDTEEDSIEEIKDDASTNQESIVVELVDKNQGADKKVVEFAVEKEVSSEVIEIVDDKKQEDVEEQPASMKATTIAKKISKTFSYDSATATITPTRKTTFARTQVIIN